VAPRFLSLSDGGALLGGQHAVGLFVCRNPFFRANDIFLPGKNGVCSYPPSPALLRDALLLTLQGFFPPPPTLGGFPVPFALLSPPSTIFAPSFFLGAERVASFLLSDNLLQVAEDTQSLFLRSHVPRRRSSPSDGVFFSSGWFCSFSPNLFFFLTFPLRVLLGLRDLLSSFQRLDFFGGGVYSALSLFLAG